MKLPFKSIAISTIVNATESEEKLRVVLENILPEEVEIEREEVEGHYGDSKVILSADITRNPLLRAFWDKFMVRLEGRELSWLADNALDRIAEDCRLYLRIDKQTAVSDDKIKFSDSGDVLHLRINVSAYPAKRKIAVAKMKDFVDSNFQYGD